MSACHVSYGLAALESSTSRQCSLVYAGSLFEIALVLVRFDDLASIIVNANHSIM